MLLSSQMAFSQDKTEGKELLEAARTAQEMSGAIKSTGIIESTCTSCLKDLADKTYLLDKDNTSKKFEDNFLDVLFLIKVKDKVS